MTPIRGIRWWAAVVGALAGPADVWLLESVGLTFELNGRPAGVVLAVYLGATFAVLGYLLGAVVEARRRDRESADVIRSQMEELETTRSRLHENERLATLGSLAAGVAHEVRNPLAVIRSAAQGLEETLPRDDEEDHKACAFITAETDRLARVVESLLTFARPLEPEVREVFVDELLERVRLLSVREVSARRIRLRCDSTDRTCTVRADPDLVCQLLLGLIANAGDVLETDGDVRLGATSRDGWVELRVEDSGPGVLPDLRERIFEPFFTTRSGGTGLGLAVARRIVEAHRGSIFVEDAPGGGARFVVRLPAGRSREIAA